MFRNKAIVCVVIVGILAYYLRSWKNSTSGKLIETKLGLIQGIASNSRDGREFYEWLGIPYSKAPVGKRRFASPEPNEKWEGILDATRYGAGCIHNNIMFASIVLGEEDCLYLNVYAPKLQGRKFLPVMVYIHGGGFTGGNSNLYRPDYIMDEDVIFVSINYRLDILGFLTTGDKAVRGNMGLKDQVQALKWINQNIQSFGGDPTKVTIMGHSAGGASVNHMLLSPKSKGLFHKAISLSGAATNSWGFVSPEESIKRTKSIAISLGCPTNNSENLVECLRNTSIKDLMATVWKDSKNDKLFKPHKFTNRLVPTIELVKDKEAFLPEYPLKMLSQGKAHRVPWLIGHTPDEGLISIINFIDDESTMLEFEENWEEGLKSVFAISSSANQTQNETEKEKAKKIRDFYFPPSTRQSREKKLEAYTQLFSDSFFNFDIRESIFYQRKFSSVYPYFYNKTIGPSYSDLINIIYCERTTNILEGFIYAIKLIVAQSIFGMDSSQDNCEINHMADVSMLFPFYPVFYVSKSSKHYEFSKNYIKLLVDFATNNGSPIIFRGVTFPPTPTQGPLTFLHINNDIPQVAPEPFEKRMKFLHSLNIRDYK